MRGYVDQYGRNFPNYHYEDVKHLNNLYRERGLDYPSVIIDLNHANSNKRLSLIHICCPMKLTPISLPSHITSPETMKKRSIDYSLHNSYWSLVL